MRRRLPFFGILVSTLILSGAISSTVPDISAKIHLTNIDDTLGNLYSHERWTSPPHKDATCHLIFQAASGLLQHWSNTAYPNGHSLAIGVIPVGTTLYHGTPTGVPPPTFDWVSFDPEHASMFARGENAALLTFSPVRPLKVNPLGPRLCYKEHANLKFSGRSSILMEIVPRIRLREPLTRNILSNMER